jgi:hypothetical protein
MFYIPGTRTHCGDELFEHTLMTGFLYICYASNLRFKKKHTKLTSNGNSCDGSPHHV